MREIMRDHPDPFALNLGLGWRFPFFRNWFFPLCRRFLFPRGLGLSGNCPLFFPNLFRHDLTPLSAWTAFLETLSFVFLRGREERTEPGLSQPF